MTMMGHQYLASTPHAQADLPGGLPVRTTSSTRPPPSTAAIAYSALSSAAFSTKTSYSSPQHCDHNILTPISSGAGSPPLRQRSQPATRRRPSATPPDSQSLTPPSSSTTRMYQWPNDFSMAAPNSQTASPLSMPPLPTQDHFNLSALSEVPADNHHHHQKDDIPDPPEPYWGSFGVSTTESEVADGQAQHMHHHPYYMDNMQHAMAHVNQILAPSALIKQEDTGLPLDLDMHQQQQQQEHQLQNQQHHMANSLMQLHDGTMDAPAHVDIIQPGSPSQEDVPLDPDFASPYEIGASLKLRRNQQQQTNGNRIFRKPKVRGGARSAAAAPRHDAASKTKKRKPAPKNKEATATEDATPSNEPLQFKDGMPDTDRFLFELRRKYNNDKGKGMWDPITREYNERFNTHFDRAALQMRISRAKSKYVQWGEQDDQRLIDAARQVERQYFRQVHLKYKELGGNSQADFNVGNVEMRMVELGLAEVFMEPWKGDYTMQTRRRRKLHERQRVSTVFMEEQQDPTAQDAPAFSQPQQTHPQAQTDYATHHHHRHPQQLAIAHMDRLRFGSVELPPHTQEQVLDEIDSRGYPLEESASGTEEIYGITTGSNGSLELTMPAKAQKAKARASKKAGEDALRRGNMGMSL